MEVKAELVELGQRLSIEAEHLAPKHEVLCTIGAYIPDDRVRTAEVNAAITMILNDILASGFKGKIVVLRPYPGTYKIRGSGKVAVDEVAASAEVRESLLEYLLLGDDAAIWNAREDGRVATLHYPGLGGDHRAHIRDHFVVAREIAGEKALIMPMSSPQNDGSLDHIYVLANHLGLRLGLLPFHFEGGNFLGDGSRNYTLSDTRGKNIALFGLGSLRGLENLFGRFQEGLIFLDSPEWRRQVLYHMDLAVMFIGTQTGKTVALLSSMRKAKELLSPHYRKGRMKVREWARTCIAREYREKIVEREIKKLGISARSPGSKLHQLVTSHGIGIQDSSAWIEDGLDNLRLIPQAMKAIGAGLEQFFSDENYFRVQKYLDYIGQSLAGCGIHVEEVPALLFHDSFQPHDRLTTLNPAFLLSERMSPVPIYCPVNGVTFHGEEKLFLSSGGIIPFDDHMRAVLRRYDYVYTLLRYAITLGWVKAGAHCNFVPF